jgi:hypothetical protein
MKATLSCQSEKPSLLIPKERDRRREDHLLYLKANDVEDEQEEGR